MTDEIAASQRETREGVDRGGNGQPDEGQQARRRKNRLRWR